MKKLMLLTIFILIILPGGIVTEEEEAKSYTLIPQENLMCNYYNEKDFIASVSNASMAQSRGINLFGGVVPHHLLADKMIASFFTAVADSNPETKIK